MTVLDAQNLLYEWYQEHDSFEANRDLRKVIPIMDDEEETQSAFRLALGELETQSLISSQDYGDKKYFILTKPYDAYQQNIELSAWTSRWAAGAINEFCALIEDNTDLCNASQMSDKDIRNLVHIIQFFKQKVDEKEEIISSLSVLDKINPLPPEDDDDKQSGDKGKKKKK